MPELLGRLQSALVDRYRLEREVGAGGMATVYLAQDVRHARRVALKVLRPELAAVIGAERFLAEIQLTANLQHPHMSGCSGKAVVTPTLITGDYTCLGVASYDPSKGLKGMGKVDIKVKFTAAS